MRSAVFQFLVVGALATAWIWMLGRPLLAMLVRRSHRDSVSRFRHQQAVLGRSIGAEPGPSRSPIGLGPIVDWWTQPKERRRLQVMLGFAMATFTSVLLALALRGPFIRLFLVMGTGFMLYLMMAAAIGTRELRARERALQRWLAEPGLRQREEAARPVLREPETWALDETRDALFDESFYEPIPEFAPAAAERAEPVTATPDPESLPGDESPPGEETAAEETAAEAEPTFSAAPVERRRLARRPKGRPIYVEPEPGVEPGDDSIWVVNDR